MTKRQSPALDRLQEIANARNSERDAIIAALEAGERQVDVAQAIGRSREWVRQVWAGRNG